MNSKIVTTRLHIVGTAHAPENPVRFYFTRNFFLVVSTSYLYGEIYNIVLMKMKAYELPVKVTPDGNLDLPDALMKMLTRSQIVRVIILVNEPMDIEEQSAWSRLTAEQFLAGYSEGDAIYDNLR